MSATKAIAKLLKLNKILKIVDFRFCRDGSLRLDVKPFKNGARCRECGRRSRRVRRRAVARQWRDLPVAGSRTTAHPPTASAALRASRPVLEWFHLQHQCTVAAEPDTGNLQNTVELQQLCDSLGSGHGSPRRRFGLVW